MKPKYRVPVLAGLLCAIVLIVTSVTIRDSQYWDARVVNPEIYRSAKGTPLYFPEMRAIKNILADEGFYFKTWAPMLLLTTTVSEERGEFSVTVSLTRKQVKAEATATDQNIRVAFETAFTDASKTLAGNLANKWVWQ